MKQGERQIIEARFEWRKSWAGYGTGYKPRLTYVTVELSGLLWYIDLPLGMTSIEGTRGYSYASVVLDDLTKMVAEKEKKDGRLQMMYFDSGDDISRIPSEWDFGIHPLPPHIGWIQVNRDADGGKKHESDAAFVVRVVRGEMAAISRYLAALREGRQP